MLSDIFKLSNFQGLSIFSFKNEEVLREEVKYLSDVLVEQGFS